MEADTKPCAHKLLKKQLVAGHFWYVCCECRQKFRVEPWDGRVEVVGPQDSKAAFGRCNGG